MDEVHTHPMTTNKIETATTTWGTAKTHGLKDGDTFIYWGANPAGPTETRLVVLQRDGSFNRLVDATTRRFVSEGGAARRFWATPVGVGRIVVLNPSGKAVGKGFYGNNPERFWVDPDGGDAREFADITAADRFIRSTGDSSWGLTVSRRAGGSR